MASLNKQFQDLPLLIKIILLLPGIGWITEIVVRLSAFLNGKSTNQLIALVLFIFFGLILSIVDLVWVILKGKLILT
ncbi:MAG: hypothetical protein K2P12_00955 [Clostridia bacterium]|nr:hypothetical protein [Clostridia bacterium]